MKIDKKDIKHNVLLITPENLTDLYILSQIIETNDQVYGFTTRRVRTPGKESREGDKGERIKVYLGIKVIEVDFQDSAVDQRLRIKGTIISGPEDIISLNSAHTINVLPGQGFSLQKPAWHDFHFQMLRKSEAANRPSIGIIAIEPGVFSIAEINNYKIQVHIQERDQLPGKQSSIKVRSSSDSNFFKKVLNIAKNYFANDSIKNIVVAGPANYKAKFLTYLQEEWRANNKAILLEDLSSAFAVNELVTRQTLQKLAGEYQVLEESVIINEFEKRLGTEFEKVCYGLDQGLQCADQGALETMLLNDQLLKSNNEAEKEKVLQLMDSVEKTRVSYYIVDSKSENGRILQNFGGTIGILRYAIYFES